MATIADILNQLNSKKILNFWELRETNKGFNDFFDDHHGDGRAPRPLFKDRDSFISQVWAELVRGEDLDALTIFQVLIGGKWAFGVTWGQLRGRFTLPEAIQVPAGVTFTIRHQVSGAPTGMIRVGVTGYSVPVLPANGN